MPNFRKKTNHNNMSLEQLDILTNDLRSLEVINKEESYKTKTELLEQKLKELEEVNRPLDIENHLAKEQIADQEKQLSRLHKGIRLKRKILSEGDKEYIHLKQTSDASRIKNDMEHAIETNQSLRQKEAEIKNENKSLWTTIKLLELQNKEMEDKFAGLNNKKQKDQIDLDARE